MAKFWLPGDSDFALAMREPNLLVPGRKPIGQTVAKNNATNSKTLFYLPFQAYDLLKSKKTYNEGSYNRQSYFYLVDGTDAYFSNDVFWINTQGTPATEVWSENEIGATLDFRTQDCTIHTVVQDVAYVYSGSSLNTILSIDAATIHSINYNSSKQLWLFLGGTSQIYTGATLSTPGKKYDICVVIESGVGTVYLDGVALSPTISVGASTASSAKHWHIGCDQINQRWMRGGIASSGVWLRALSDAERLELLHNQYAARLTSANDSPFLISVPAGGGVPTLSSPGAINVLSDRATPQVTLTF